jgi:hypothetical protein
MKPREVESTGPARKNVTAVGVFSATMHRERDELGARVTEWLRARPEVRVSDAFVTQSSDAKYHCLTIVLLCEPSSRRGIYRSEAHSSGSGHVEDFFVEVFSGTKASERNLLGSQISEWLDSNPAVRVVRKFVRQSSDESFHCVSFVLFCSGGVLRSAREIRERYRRGGGP